jgi:hypothetical protein
MAANIEPTPAKIPWTDVVASKRTIRNEHIQKHLVTSVDSSYIVRITNIKDVDSLTLMIENGDISAEEIVRAYIVK